MNTATTEAQRRWQLVLGEGSSAFQDDTDQLRDEALTALYPKSSPRGASPSKTSTTSDLVQEFAALTQLFPESIQEVLQTDALERVGLRRLLSNPDLIESIQPDVKLAADLLRVRPLLPAKLLDNARRLIQRIVEALQASLAEPMGQALRSAFPRPTPTTRPRHGEIDWPATIHANLRHYQPRYRTLIPAKRLGRRRQSGLHRDFIICVDQSGSMAESLIHTSIAAASLSQWRGLRTTLLAFDTQVADLTERIHDPVDILMQLALGGGTDIASVLYHARNLVCEPANTTVFLLSDLIDGGPRDVLLRELEALLATGAQVISLLSLNASGAPVHDPEMARELEERGIPVLACTPAEFPRLVTQAITGGSR